MNQLTLAGVIGVAVLGQCTGKAIELHPTPTDTPAMQPAAAGAQDEWALWTGPTKLRGANTWQKRSATRGGAVWPAYTRADLEKLESWGANYVNLSLPGPMAEWPNERGEYQWDDRAWANIDSMVTRADSAGLFVVVSFRTGPGRSEFVFDTSERPIVRDLWRERAALEAWVKMWGRTADSLRGRRAVIGYDLMVEPLLEPEGRSVRPRHWYALAHRLIDTIRRVDPVTPILVSVAPQGHPNGLRDLNATSFKPHTRGVVFTIHQYAPWTYTHQETTHSTFTCDTPRVATGKKSAPRRRFDDSVRTELRTVYHFVKGRKDTLDIVLAVNEFGVTRWVESADVFMAEQMAMIEALPANHAVWVWDPEECLGWDAMNFRNGPDSAYHFEVPQSALADTIKSAWRRRNRVRLP